MGVQFGYDNFDALMEGTKLQISLENIENNVIPLKILQISLHTYLEIYS